MELKETGSSTLSVSPNTEDMQASIESFVSAYNTLITVTNALTKVNATTAEDGSESTDAGALVGDASVRSLLTSIRSALTDTSGASGGLSVLSQLGVTTSKSDGTLTIDSDKLASALDTHYGDVKEFFTGSNGLFTRLDNATALYTQSGGLLDSRANSLQGTLDGLTEQQASLDRRIDTLTTSLYNKYNTMDALVAQLQATSSSLLTTLEALNNKDD